MKRCRRWMFAGLSFLLGVLGAGWSITAREPTRAPVEPRTEKSQFIRIVRNATDVPTAMQTAVVHYVATTGPHAGAKVDLIGAVHIGERAYYKQLNELFTHYDVLLYELVAPKGTKIPKGGTGGSRHPVGLMQEGMSDMLGLVHQMSEVDYTKKNFIHADMTPDEFSDSMEKRGESWWSMAFRAMGQSIAMQASKPNEHPEYEMLAAMFDRNPELRLKRAFAKQFEDMEETMGAFDGKDGSTIITERNKKALEVLGKQLKKGKRTIGIFYGAGHLVDMDRRLLEDFGFKRAGTDWLTAWDMSDPAKQPKK